MGATAIAVLLTALASDPVDFWARDRVDLIEVNHYHDDSGRPVLSQVIFYEWCRWRARHVIRDFRLLRSSEQAPTRDWKQGDYVARWSDNGLPREVRAAASRETWTQYDPEIVDREHLEKSRRRELSGLPPLVARSGASSTQPVGSDSPAARR